MTPVGAARTTAAPTGELRRTGAKTGTPGRPRASKRYDRFTTRGPRHRLRSNGCHPVRRRMLLVTNPCRSNPPSGRPRLPIRRGAIPVRPDDTLRSPVRVLRRPLVDSRLTVTAGPGHGKQPVHRLHRGHHDADIGDDSPLRSTPRAHRHVPPTRRTATAVFVAPSNRLLDRGLQPARSVNRECARAQAQRELRRRRRRERDSARS